MWLRVRSTLRNSLSKLAYVHDQSEFTYKKLSSCRAPLTLALTRWGRAPSGLSLYKMLFHFEALLWQSIILLLRTPPAKPTLLQYYSTTIAQYTPPPTDPFWLCHTPYNIGDDNIV